MFQYLKEKISFNPICCRRGETNKQKIRIYVTKCVILTLPLSLSSHTGIHTHTHTQLLFFEIETEKKQVNIEVLCFVLSNFECNNKDV